MRILVTGCAGFMGSHFLDYLASSSVQAEVLGVSRTKVAEEPWRRQRLQFTSRSLDLLDDKAFRDLLLSFKPTHILHLAASSSVGFSWRNPASTFVNNTSILLNLLEQVRELDLGCRILSVGSSEEYGSVSSDMLPLREGARLQPTSPYAVARVAQEMLSEVYVRGYGLEIVMTRSFNHIGTRQRPDFVVPSLAKQLIALRASAPPGRLATGNRSIVRDFVDVRDVGRAYFDLLTAGTPGETYNVCSGRGVSIDWIIAQMQEYLGTSVELYTDMTLVRPAENPEVVGSYDKIASELGWRPSIPIRDSLAWILDWWQALADSE